MRIMFTILTVLVICLFVVMCGIGIHQANAGFFQRLFGGGSVVRGMSKGNLNAIMQRAGKACGAYTKPISVYRAGATFYSSRCKCRKKSYHSIQGGAIDFVTNKKACVWKWINSHHSGGAILYSRNGFNHIHIDIGPKIRAYK